MRTPERMAQATALPASAPEATAPAGAAPMPRPGNVRPQRLSQWLVERGARTDDYLPGTLWRVDDEVPRQQAGGVEVEPALVVERRDHRREDPAEPRHQNDPSADRSMPWVRIRSSCNSIQTSW